VAQDADPTRFVLYYRENCHLCESMRLALVKLARTLPLHWKEVDIDRDVALIREFDVLVPALHFEGREVCHHFINEAAIRVLLTD
jgi:hypothetical protein